MNYYAINRMHLLVVENYNALDSFLKTLEPEEKIRYQKTKEDIQGMIEPLYAEFDSLDIYFNIKAIANSTNMYFSHFEKLYPKRQGIEIIMFLFTRQVIFKDIRLDISNRY